MASLRVALISVWLFGCTWSSTAGDKIGGQPTDAGFRPTSWVDVMRGLDKDCAELDQWLLHPPQGDLARSAQRAERAAGLMRRGYGEFEDETVPGFARFARDAESWLLQIAIEARQGHGDIAADVYRTGRRQHCNSCHAAHERVHG